MFRERLVQLGIILMGVLPVAMIIAIFYMSVGH